MIHLYFSPGLSEYLSERIASGTTFFNTYITHGELKVYPQWIPWELDQENGKAIKVKHKACGYGKIEVISSKRLTDFECRIVTGFLGLLLTGGCSVRL